MIQDHQVTGTKVQLVRGRIGIALLVSVILAGVLQISLTNVESAKLVAVPIAVEATPLPLNRTDLEMVRVGRLRYVAGWALTSDEPRFGGFRASCWIGIRRD